MDPASLLDGSFFRKQDDLKAPTSAPSKSVFGPNDLFIAVMGVTGSGKSTFIKRCTACDVEVGHGLQSHTKMIQIYPCRYGDKTVHLIDTPGFDDTFRRDIDVLKDISFWLSKAYDENLRLTGIVYLHRITDPRLGGVALKDLNMFKKLCGEDAFASVALVTTFWEDVNPRTGEMRELELRSTDDFYGEMIRRQALLIRHSNTESSARSILATLVSRGTTTVLHIQRQLGGGKQLDETDAGEELQKDLKEQKRLYNERLRATEQEMQEALNVNNQRRADELAQQQEAFQAKILEAEKSRDEMRISMEKLYQEKQAELNKMREQWTHEHEEREQAAEVQAAEVRRFQKALKAAEQIAEKRRKDQDNQLRQMKEQNQKAEATMQTLREHEQKNQLLKENLERARLEGVRQEEELQETRHKMDEMASLQLHAPQNYTYTHVGDPPPPDYASVVGSLQSKMSADDTANRRGRYVDNVSQVAAAGMTLGAAALIAAPTLACSVM